MQIKSCPVLHPSEDEFNDFYRYIHHLDRTYKNQYGMVKIVPPARWKPQRNDYQAKIENLTVKHPIQQNVQGRAGFYQSKNIVQTKMSLKAYRKYAEKESSKVATTSIEEKEKLFWKTITYSPPIYGADLTGTLMDEEAGQWNLNSLNSLLRYALTQKVKGVNEPYCYIGAWKAFFSWHKEDLDLSALNYIHEGASKFWYAIRRDDAHFLEEEARLHFKTQAQKCSDFLRHKTFLINPHVVLERHPEMKVHKIEHKAGEIMMVFGGAYHSGFNTGFNIAEAVNYATLDWLGELLNITFCKCFRKSVRGEIESILYNLENSSKYEEFKELNSFKDLQWQVIQQQIKEGIISIQDVAKPIQMEVELPVKMEPENPLNVSNKTTKVNKKKIYEQWKPKNNKLKDFTEKSTMSLKIKKPKEPKPSHTKTGKTTPSKTSKKESKIPMKRQAIEVKMK